MAERGGGRADGGLGARLGAALRRLLAPAPAAQRYEGPFADWDEARRRADGYDRPEILRQVRAAALEAKQGRAAFERDGIAFAERQYPFPVLAMLLYSAARHGGALSVLDVGGSLGSAYFQCRPLLAEVARLRWSVVEQPAFVACGREEFAGEELAFYGSIGECLAHERPTLALFGSSLQYLPDPYGALREVEAAGVPEVVIDRTPRHDGAGDLVFVQHVPPAIYRASYACRVFGADALEGALARGYRKVATLPAPEAPAAAGATTIRFSGSGWTRRAP